MSLQCEQKSVPVDGKIWMTRRVTYKAPPESKPIIIHTQDLFEEGQIYRRCGDTTWDDAEVEDMCCAGLDFDGPDTAVSVTEDRRFRYLEPGEIWTVSTFSYDFREYFSPSLAPGDEIRYIFAGCKVFWWNWGSREEQADTTVMFSSTGLVITDPKDNNGRPALVVPASNVIEFSIE